VYSYWGTADTVTAISTYMLNKITEELKEKGLYGAYIQNVDTVLEVFGLKDEQAYSRATNSFGSYNNEKILFGEDLNATQKFYEIIKQSIILVINRLGMSGNMTENFYDAQEVYRAMGAELLWQLKINIVAKIQNQPTVGPRGILPSTVAIAGFEPTEEQIDYIMGPNRNDWDAIDAHEPSDWYSHDIQYYLPVPLFTAIHIIYFDRVVDLSTRYPKYEYETNSRIGIADDAFLLAINPTSLPRFAVPYTGFPTTALGETFYSMNQLERRSAVEDIECRVANADLRRLDEILDDLQERRDKIFELVGQGDELFHNVSNATNVADDLGAILPLTILAASVNVAGDSLSEAAEAVAAVGSALYVIGQIIPNLFDSDFNGTNGNAKYIQSWWNWAKRIAIYGHDSANPVGAGLDYNYILTNSFTHFGGFGNDAPLDNWGITTGQRASIAMSAITSWNGESAWESAARIPHDSKPAIVALYNKILELAEEYQEYLRRFEDLITQGFAQISYDNWVDTHPDWITSHGDTWWRGRLVPSLPPPTWSPDVGPPAPGMANAADYPDGWTTSTPQLPSRARYITECSEADLIRTMIINIKEQQRMFAEARNNLR
jgi:hypothetical protein